MADLINNEEGACSVVGPPEIKWNTEHVDIETLENGSGLPAVVKYEECVSGCESVPTHRLPIGLKMYAGQPVLFYTRTRKRHVTARTIYRDREGPYFEVGQILDVPEDFNGWFEFVPPDFGRAPVCRTIAQITEIMPRKFFTRTKIRAIRVIAETDDTGENKAADDSSAEGQSYTERILPAGSVLTVLGTFVGKWQTTAETGMLKRKSKAWTTTDITYLKCEAMDRKEVLIPVTTRGRFNVVYEQNKKDSRAVYRMKDILSDFELPVKVRMVYGKAPTVPCIYTGMLILKEQSRFDTLIGSTVLNKRHALFEIPVSTKCRVTTAADADDYTNLQTYIDANDLCSKYSNSYGTLIKLSPDIDKDAPMVQHIPTEKRKTRDESLKTLDLITNISTTDNDPMDYFMDSSDNDSMQSSEMGPLGFGEMMELKEISLPKGQTISTA